MPRQLDPRIIEILEKYGENPRDTQGVIWDCHGTWVVYHKALERVAARAGIEFTRPEIIRSERDEAVILASGSLDGRTDWEIGEALIGVNYRVSGKQAAYVYAMATKRARDRLILKLVGLHGLLYSEEEADEFRQSAPSRAGADQAGGGVSNRAASPPAEPKHLTNTPRVGEPNDPRRGAIGAIDPRNPGPAGYIIGDAPHPEEQDAFNLPPIEEKNDRTIADTLIAAMKQSKTEDELAAWARKNKAALRDLPGPLQDEIIHAGSVHRSALQYAKETA